MRLRSVFVPPTLPACYGRVEGKESKEVLAFLYFNAAREEWIIYPPDDAPQECEEAFSV